MEHCVVAVKYEDDLHQCPEQSVISWFVTVEREGCVFTKTRGDLLKKFSTHANEIFSS